MEKKINTSFWDYVIEKYPYPIAYQAKIVLDQSDPKRRFDEALKLGEWIFRYVGILNILAYIDSHRKSAQLSQELLQVLNEPAMGAWLEIGRKLTEFNDNKDRFWSYDLSHFYKQEPEKIIEERNRQAHFAWNPTDEQYAEMQLKVLQKLEQLLNLEFYTCHYLTANNRPLEGWQIPIRELDGKEITLYSRSDPSRHISVQPFMYVTSRGFRLISEIQKINDIELTQPHFFLFQSLRRTKKRNYIESTSIEPGIDFPLLIAADIIQLGNFLHVTIKIEDDLDVWGGNQTFFTIRLENRGLSELIVEPFQLRVSKGVETVKFESIKDTIELGVGDSEELRGSLIYSEEKEKPGWLRIDKLEYTDGERFVELRPGPVLRFKCHPHTPPAPKLYIESSNGLINERKIPVEAKTTLFVFIENPGGPVKDAELEMELNEAPTETKFEKQIFWENTFRGGLGRVKIAEVSIEPQHVGKVEFKASLKSEKTLNGDVLTYIIWDGEVVREGQPLLVVAEQPQVRFIERVGAEVHLIKEFQVKNEGTATSLTREIKLGKPPGASNITLTKSFEKLAAGRSDKCIVDVIGNIKQSTQWPGSSILYSDLDATSEVLLEVPGVSLSALQAHRFEELRGRETELQYALEHLVTTKESGDQRSILWVKGRPGIGKSQFIKSLISKLLDQVDPVRLKGINQARIDCKSESGFLSFLSKVVSSWLRPRGMPVDMWVNVRAEKLESQIKTIVAEDRPPANARLLANALERLLLTGDLAVTDPVMSHLVQAARKHRSEITSVIELSHCDAVSSEYLNLLESFLLKTPSEVKDKYILVSEPEPRIESFLHKFAEISRTVELQPLHDNDIEYLIENFKPFPPFDEEVKHYVVKRAEGIPGVVRRLCDILSLPAYTRISNDQISFRPGVRRQLDSDLDTTELGTSTIAYIKNVLDVQRREYSDAFFQTMTIILGLAACLDAEFYSNEIRAAVTRLLPSHLHNVDETRNCLDHLAYLEILDLVDSRTHKYRLAGGVSRRGLIELLFYGRPHRKTIIHKTLGEYFLAQKPPDASESKRMKKIAALQLMYADVVTQGQNLDSMLEGANAFVNERDFQSAMPIFNAIKSFKDQLNVRQRMSYLHAQGLALLNHRLEDRSKQWAEQARETLNEINAAYRSMPRPERRSEQERVKHFCSRLYWVLKEPEKALTTLSNNSWLPLLRTKIDSKDRFWQIKNRLLRARINHERYGQDDHRAKISKALQSDLKAVQGILTLDAKTYPPNEWLDLIIEYVETLIDTGRIDQAREILSTLRDEDIGKHDAEKEARLLYLRASVFQKTSEKCPQKERKHRLAEATYFAERSGDIQLIYQSNFSYGVMLYESRDYAGAIDHFERCKINLPITLGTKPDLRLTYYLGKCHYILATSDDTNELSRREHAQRALQYKQEDLSSIKEDDLSRKGDVIKLFEQIGNLHGILGNRVQELENKEKAFELDGRPLALSNLMTTRLRAGIYHLRNLNFALALQNLNKALTVTVGKHRRLCLAKIAKAHFLNHNNISALQYYQSYLETLFALNIDKVRKANILLFIYERTVEIWGRAPDNTGLVTQSLKIVEYLVELPEKNRDRILERVVRLLRRRKMALHAFTARTLFADALLSKGHRQHALRIYRNAFMRTLRMYDEIISKEARDLLSQIFRGVLECDPHEHQKQRYGKLLRTASIKHRDYYLLSKIHMINGDYYWQHRNSNKAQENYKKCERIVNLKWKDTDINDLISFMRELSVALYMVNESKNAHGLLLKCLKTCLDKRVNNQIQDLFSKLSDFHGEAYSFLKSENPVLRIYREAETRETLAEAIDQFTDNVIHPEVFHLLYDTSKILSHYTGNERLTFDIHNYLYAHQYNLKNQLHDLGLAFFSRERPFLGIGLMYVSFQKELEYWQVRSFDKSVIYHNTLLSVSDLTKAYLDVHDYINATQMITEHFLPKLQETVLELEKHILKHKLVLDLLPLIDVTFSSYHNLVNYAAEICRHYNINAKDMERIIVFELMTHRRSQSIFVDLKQLQNGLDIVTKTCEELKRSQNFASHQYIQDSSVSQEVFHKVNMEAEEWFASRFPIIGTWLNYVGEEKRMLQEALTILAPIQSLDRLLAEVAKPKDKQIESVAEFVERLKQIDSSIDFDKLLEQMEIINQSESVEGDGVLWREYPLVVSIKMAKVAHQINNSELTEKWCERGLSVDPDNQYLRQLQVWKPEHEDMVTVEE